MISIKALAGAKGDQGSDKRKPQMPAEAIPFIVFVVAAFSVFMLAVGSAWIMTNQPGDKG